MLILYFYLKKIGFSHSDAKSLCKCYNGNLARIDTRKFNMFLSLAAPVDKDDKRERVWLGSKFLTIST